MKKTINIRIGKGSISHNNRKFVAKNVDEKRVKDNVILCCENLKDTYDDLFGAALSEYNAKQKRKDRRIENYLDHIINALLGENETLREKVRAARSLQNSFSALQRELDSWKQRYKKVIEFIENLGLKDKLEQFLHPITHVKRGR